MKPIPRFTTTGGAVVLASALFSACVHAEDITIPGSGTCEYVLGQLANEFNTGQKCNYGAIPASAAVAHNS